MRTCLLVFTTILYRLAFAQSWAPQGATWHYGYADGFGGVGYVRIVADGDTVVQGHSCRILAKTSTGYNFAQNAPYSFHPPSEVTYAEEGVVYLLNYARDRFDTLFCTTCPIGASWRLAAHDVQLPCDTVSRMTVLATGHGTVQGVDLAWSLVEVGFATYPELSYTDTIYERMGPVHAYLLPYDQCMSITDAQEGGPFRCYNDDLISYDPSGLGCDYILGVEAQAFPADVRVGPNPTHDLIEVRTPGLRSVQLMDLSGRVLRQRAGIEGDVAQLDLRDMPSGTYLLRVEGRTTAAALKVVRD